MFQIKRDEIRKWILIFLVSVGLILFISPIINAQSTTPPPESSTTTPPSSNCVATAPLKLQTKRVTLSGNNNSEAEVKLGDRIRVEVSGLGEAIDNNQIAPRKILLYLDGRVLKGIYGEPVGGDRLEFHLKRTNDSQDAWNIILGSPKEEQREITVGVGSLTKEFPSVKSSEPPTLNLTIFNRRSRIIYSVGILGVSIVFIILVATTPILRDSVPPNSVYSTKELTKSQQRPFSLGQCQMAFWFFLIISSFTFISWITHDYTNIITSQSLVLMGISATTGVSSVVIGNTKYAEMESQLQILKQEKDALDSEIKGLESQINALEQSNSLEEKKELLVPSKLEIEKKKAQIANKDNRINSLNQKLSLPVSKNFLLDILSDTNGISFHRFQILIWTLILGVIFLVEVWQNLTMPEFDTTLLTLQGISSGTYLGFKFPEQ